MSLKLENLDDRTRSLMMKEIELDASAGIIYFSPRLNDLGQHEYLALLREAISFKDDLWLAEQIRKKNMLRSHEQRRKPKGGYSVALVPVTAAETLAEGEFNRYCIRALCVRAIEEGISSLEVYRAKQVMNARSESKRLIGQLVDPKRLLEDLRSNVGIDTALGLPPGPNSGLSVRIPLS